MKLALATYCKGRLKHLEQTLPTYIQFAKEHDALIGVVDYNCPELNGRQLDGVEMIYPDKDLQGFNQSHARNLAINHFRDKADILILMDCDTGLQANFISNINLIHKGKTFVCGMPTNPMIAYGSVGAYISDFLEIRGFNEAFIDWGFDDVDGYMRLQKKGMQMLGWFNDTLFSIEHGDEERLQYYSEKNRDVSNHKNSQLKLFKSIL
jgi:hypothetical protein